MTTARPAAHGARSQKTRQRFREDVHPTLAERHPIARDLLADELADYRQLREHVNKGAPVSPRSHLYRAQEMKRARGQDAKDTVKLIRSLLADEHQDSGRVAEAQRLPRARALRADGAEGGG